MQTLDFDGDVVVLTGAGAGLGRAYAQALADMGARLVINDVDPGVVGFAEELKGRGADVLAVVGDISRQNSIDLLISSALDTFGRIDALINNAGIASRVASHLDLISNHRKLMDVNYFGAIALIEACLPSMIRQRHGRIVNVISTSLFGVNGFSAYAATKGALLGFTRCAALDVADYGVRINLLAPGAYTPMTRSSDLEPEAVEALARNAPPEKVAPVAAWLAHRSCDCSGLAFSAAGGRASLMALVETPPVSVDEGDVATILSGLVTDSRLREYPIKERLRQ